MCFTTKAEGKTTMIPLDTLLSLIILQRNILKWETFKAGVYVSANSPQDKTNQCNERITEKLQQLKFAVSKNLCWQNSVCWACSRAQTNTGE